MVFETVRKMIACRTPVLGCHLYRCPQCQRLEVVPHSCKSRFCPTCGKHATDRWAEGVLNDLLDVPYHHLVLAVPAHLRSVLHFNGQPLLRDWVQDLLFWLQQLYRRLYRRLFLSTDA
ncbi:MAG TPA: transposase zinc-binding domain-containing protein [Thermoanaerobaculia bacterium]|nr:transposase zinc-binding domain-containing protein [Thermoanaerobaculia bacterium]